MSGQNKKSMELQNVIFDREKLGVFVKESFQDTNLTKMQKTVMGHPLIAVLFNKTLLPGDKSFSFCGIPVDSIYVYAKTKTEFCTYLILKIEITEFDKISAVLGYPENVSKEDYIKRDFDFLFWPVGSFGMFINKSHSSERGTFLIQAYNMPYKEIADMNILK